MMEMRVKEATGCRVTEESLKKSTKLYITDFGASPENDPVRNTKAIGEAIQRASRMGGAEVVVPAGDFRVYTIHMKSHVNLYLSEGAVLHAARTDIRHSYETQEGEGGNYEEPEVNLYAGLQDHGHTYFANSLIYGADLEDVMIHGPGLIDGSYFNEETGYREYVLLGGDPQDGTMRNERGHAGEWFGNKGIALVRSNRVVLKDFSLVIGGHFAVITEGVTDMLAENLCIDTTRDAFDVDCCQDVTIRSCVMNSLTDDGLVVKASYGAGLFMPSKNILVEDCIVSGYDAGSVLAGVYSRDKLIATDRCGPTGRVKLGTESTCGYDQVTVRRVHFQRSRGFALEAVDCSDLTNIIFEDCTMDNVSSSPIFIRAGERGRFPVTGISGEEVIRPENNVRLDNREWVLPNLQNYASYPVRRYLPSYNKTKKATVDGYSEFYVVDETEPARINPVNLEAENLEEIRQSNPSLRDGNPLKFANAVGCAGMPKVANIRIQNVTITNADPRYPILIMGLTDSKVENVCLKNIDVTFRGGMKMEHAVEQRQLNTNWAYTQFETRRSIQSLPWLVNTFFLKEEGLLPRADWDETAHAWKDDPYNVPEMPGVYPEPSNWGILPAYGIYARHIDGLTMDQVSLRYMAEDERHPIVLDDASRVTIMEGCTCDHMEGVEEIAAVTDYFRRPTNMEYIPNEPYFKTTVEELTAPKAWKTKQVSIQAPAPGTPRDGLYGYPTAPTMENGYRFAVDTDAYPLPATVHRPFLSFAPGEKGERNDRGAIRIRRPDRSGEYGIMLVECLAGEPVHIRVNARDPYSETEQEQAESKIYNEAVKKMDHTVLGKSRPLRVWARELPRGAVFDEKERMISWTPEESGEYMMKFGLDDGILEEEGAVRILVKPV